MKRFYTLLFNITLISSFSVAKAEKINAEQETEKSAKVRSSKLIDYQIKRGDTLFSIAKRHHSTVRKIMLINGMKSSEHLIVGKSLKVPTETVEYAKAEKAAAPAAVPKNKIENATAANKKVAPLKVPAKTEKLTPPIVKKAPKSKKLIHTVVKGDTLSKIAKNNHITIGALRKANKLKVKDHIILGQKLIIPRAKKPKNKPIKPKAEAENTKPETMIAARVKKESAAKRDTYEVKKGDSLYRIAVNHHTTVDLLKKANKIKSEKSLKLGQLLTIPAPKISSVEPKIEVATTEPEKQKEEVKIASVAKSNKSKILTHTIKKGDSLYSIARNNHITVDALKKANKIKSEKNLKLGQLLTIPLPAAENKKAEIKVAKAESGKKKSKIASVQKESKTKMLTHTVKKGDSLYIIAKNNHTTVKVLREANKIKSEKSLKLGQLIKIPVPVTEKSETEVRIAKADTAESTKKAKAASAEKTAGSKTLTHTVKKGDLLYTIAKNNHVSVKALKKANNIKSVKSLKPGQILTIPGAVNNASEPLKLAESEKKKEQTKIAKAKTEAEKSIKLAKAESKKKTKIASAKKSSSKKLSQEHKQSKKSFLSRLTSGSKSPLKLSAAKKQLGKRYVWGAEGPYSFDCSGFTSYVCKKSGVCLPRRSIDQSKVGKRVSRKNLKPGDLVFFDTSRRHRGYVNHVGIYLGNNKFIHASSAKKKVVIASLEKPFYKSRFKWGRRVKTKS